MDTPQITYIGIIVKEQPTAQCFLDSSGAPYIQVDSLGVRVSENGCVSLMDFDNNNKKHQSIHTFQLNEHQAKLIEECDELRAHIISIKWQQGFQTGKRIIETRMHIRRQQEQMLRIEQQIKKELELVFLLCERLTKP